jgi:hypothetical protein
LSFDKTLTVSISIVALLSVVAYISQAFQGKPENRLRSEIAQNRSEAIVHDNFIAIITVISVLASSISTGTALPPGLNITAVKNDHLPASVIENESIVVVHVAMEEISRSVERLIQVVKRLVGELSFATALNQLGSMSRASIV